MMMGIPEILFSLAAFLVFVGMIVVAAAIFAFLVRPSRDNRDRRPVRETLDQLYASGQITREEYLERKQVLGLEP